MCKYIAIRLDKSVFIKLVSYLKKSRKDLVSEDRDKSIVIDDEVCLSDDNTIVYYKH